MGATIRPFSRQNPLLTQDLSGGTGDSFGVRFFHRHVLRDAGPGSTQNTPKKGKTGMQNMPEITFNAKAVEPVECLKEGWALIRDQYWLFVGMALVGILIGAAVPLGILYGPMMCGIYFALFQKRRGNPVEFGYLFKGFDYFGQSVIATLLHIVPILIVVVPAYILFYVVFLVTMISMSNDSSGLGPVLMILMVIVFWLFVFTLVLLVSIGFTFALPLIVDRRLPGFDAVKLSFRAAKANFLGLLGLSFLSFLLGIAGVLCCYVGMFLVFPISFAGIASAYERVFGLSSEAPISNVPPPPPHFT